MMYIFKTYCILKHTIFTIYWHKSQYENIATTKYLTDFSENVPMFNKNGLNCFECFDHPR